MFGKISNSQNSSQYIIFEVQPPHDKEYPSPYFNTKGILSERVAEVIEETYKFFNSKNIEVVMKVSNDITLIKASSVVDIAVFRNFYSS